MSHSREGTVKLLGLLRPATGELRGTAVSSSRNAVLHPWLKQHLEEILQQVPDPGFPLEPKEVRQV
jgi:hypothetical protein